MKFEKTSNPSFGSDVFRKSTFAGAYSERMTVEGTANKTFLLLLMAGVSASLVWKYHFAGYNMMPWMMLGAIGGLIMALVSIFSHRYLHLTAPAYALFEGLFLGGLSAMLNAAVPGIVMQAVGLTFGVFVVMLALYRFGIVRATEKFKAGVVAATGGVFFFYLISWVLSLFGVQLALLHDGGWLSIGISLVIVGIAALNLVLDFDQIEEGVHMGAPKQMEWYGAFGLMVTLVWLYVEMLRLLSKLSSD